MKIDLSNRELKDIYGGLCGVTTHETYHISQMEKENREEHKELLKSMRERVQRQMVLINKITKLIDWEKN